LTVDSTRSLCTDELKKCGCVCVRVVMFACIYRRKTFGIFVERHVQFSRRAHVVAPNASIYKFILYTLFVCSVYYFTSTPFSKRECVHLQYDFFPNESRLPAYTFYLFRCYFGPRFLVQQSSSYIPSIKFFSYSFASLIT